MRQLGFKSYFIPAGPEGEGAIEPITMRIPEAGVMELQVVGGGPVFLFNGAITAAEAFQLINSEAGQPNYLLAAVRGMAAWRELSQRESEGQMTLYSDTASIGHISIGHVRMLEYCHA
jgi:hypothetical protein